VQPGPPHGPAVTDLGVLRALMSRHAAIGRDAAGLAAARDALAALTVTRRLASRPALEAAALTLAAGAVLAAAADRTESRGCHVRADFPGRDDRHWRRSLLVRLSESGHPEVVGELAGATR
jgi:L-aspartate oxidase